MYKQSARIRAKMSEKGLIGRQLGAQRNHQKRLDRLSTIKRTATSEYSNNLGDSTFIAGLVLYLAEGSKKAEQFQFMNSDPMLILYMIRWITTFGRLTQEQIYFRLFIHEVYTNEQCETYWINRLNISERQMLKTIFKPTGREHKKNPNYRGCMRIEVRGSELYWKILAWRDCFYITIR